MNNDGLRDLFVANGIYQDLTDQDYLQYVSSEEVIQSVVSGKKVDFKRLIDIIPSEKVPNHSYLNQGEFSFDFLQRFRTKSSKLFQWVCLWRFRQRWRFRLGRE